MKIYPQAIQDTDEFVCLFIRTEMWHYITFSAVDPLLLNGCRQNESQTADKTITIIHKLST